MTDASNSWRLAAIGALLACAVLVVLLCVVVAPVAPPVVWSAAEQQERTAAGLVVASPAPDFALATVAGDSVRLAALLGQQVAVVFVGADCHYCERLADKLPGLGPTAGKVVLVCAGPREAAVRFERAHPLSYPVLVDSAGVVQQEYQVRGVPALCLVDARGLVSRTASGLPEVWKALEGFTR